MDGRRRFRDPERVAQVMGFEPLAAAGAPLEYWFFRVTTPGLALLVDFIVRRRASSEVRVSYWNGGLGQVARTVAPSALVDGDEVAIAGCSLTARASRGRVGELEWDLALDPGPTRLDPRNALVRRLRPFDMELVSWPRAEISGTVTVHGHLHPVSPTPALLTHYWGERLPVRWTWISANQFAGERVALEAMVLRTHLWSARRPLVTVGYLFLGRPGGDELVVSPMNGLIRLDDRGGELTVRARRFGRRPIELAVSAPPERYNDLGDGIRQTLLGTCTLAGGPTATGTCGVERRR